MLDRIGISAASLCAIHCMLLPILLPVLPLLGLSFLADHHWEHVFLLVSATIGCTALLGGFRKYHRKIYPLCLLILGITIYWHIHDLPDTIRPFIIVLGASLIAGAHLINIRLCKSCVMCNTENEEAHSQCQHG